MARDRLCPATKVAGRIGKCLRDAALLEFLSLITFPDAGPSRLDTSGLREQRLHIVLLALGTEVLCHRVCCRARQWELRGFIGKPVDGKGRGTYMYITKFGYLGLKESMIVLSKIKINIYLQQIRINQAEGGLLKLRRNSASETISPIHDIKPMTLPGQPLYVRDCSRSDPIWFLR